MRTWPVRSPRSDWISLVTRSMSCSTRRACAASSSPAE